MVMGFLLVLDKIGFYGRFGEYFVDGERKGKRM
jgi:hypothetical protein